MLFLLVSSLRLKAIIVRPFELVCFVFPIIGYVMFSRELAFCLFNNCACIYTWIARNLKETVFWGNITWSEMGKQKIQAKKAYSKLEYRVCFFFCLIVFGSFEQWSVLKWGMEKTVLWEYICKKAAHDCQETMCHTPSLRIPHKHLLSLP